MNTNEESAVNVDIKVVHFQVVDHYLWLDDSQFRISVRCHKTERLRKLLRDNNFQVIGHYLKGYNLQFYVYEHT